MNKSTGYGILIGILALGVLPHPVHAQGRGGPAPGAAVVSSGDVNGDEDRGDLESIARHFNVKVAFFPSEDAMAPLQVTFVNAAGRVVLDYSATGAWFWTHLPAGDYTVTVAQNTRRETRRIKVGEEPLVLTFFIQPRST